MATFRITTSIQETVRENEHITKVFVDKSGNHYFQAFDLAPNKGGVDKKETWKAYGRGVHGGMRLVPGPNVDGAKEAVSIGKPGTEIVKEYTRDEILATQAIPDDHSIMAQLLADPNSKAEIGRQLLADQDFVALLKSALAPATAEVAKTK